jgi:aspartyl-tRNA(Asn)/glutamyl-tRNA(Gln) amidotransferase subunit C
MSVDAATVRRIAHLARIAVAEEEVEHLQGEINAILAFVEQLSEVNVEGVEPMTSVTPMEMKKRTDVVTDGDIRDDVLKNAEGGGIKRCEHTSLFHDPRASVARPGDPKRQILDDR